MFIFLPIIAAIHLRRRSSTTPEPPSISTPSTCTATVPFTLDFEGFGLKEPVSFGATVELRDESGRNTFKVSCPLSPTASSTAVTFDNITVSSEQITKEAADLVSNIASCADEQRLKELVTLICPIAALRPEAFKEAIPQYALDYRCNNDGEGPHNITVDSASKFKLYPNWRPVNLDQIAFNKPYIDYHPIYFNKDVLYTKSWAANRVSADANYISVSDLAIKKETDVGPDPLRFHNSQIGAIDSVDQIDAMDIKPLPASFNKTYFPLKTDNHGFPLNPCGRTGIVGRGNLGRWGPQFAVDTIFTHTNETLKVFLVQQSPQDPWVIPGSFRRLNKETRMLEDLKTAASRTLENEAGINAEKIFDVETFIIYSGYVDDPRNTDNAWVETTAIWRNFDGELPQEFNKEGIKGEWKPFLSVLDENLIFPPHRFLLKLAFLQLRNPTKLSAFE